MPAWLTHGFRPFFFAAAVRAAATLPAWIVMLATGAALPSRFDPLSWHIHEMLFGFVMAAIAGSACSCWCMARCCWAERPRARCAYVAWSRLPRSALLQARAVMAMRHHAVLEPVLVDQAIDQDQAADHQQHGDDDADPGDRPVVVARRAFVVEALLGVARHRVLGRARGRDLALARGERARRLRRAALGFVGHYSPSALSDG
jgi:uncharacterized protein involved in response to NO